MIDYHPAPMVDTAVETTSAAPTLLLSVKQVASALSCSQPTVFRLLREGKLTAVRLPSGMRRVRASDLQSFVDSLS